MLRIPGLEPGEEVKLFVRRHWVALARGLVGPVVLAVPPVAVRVGLTYRGVDLFEEPLGLGGLLLGLAGHLIWLIALLFALSVFVDYYLDTWVVTDRRLISIEQAGLFARTIAQLHLARVQDATARVEGPLATVLDYGDVFIQTAGEQERFIFTSIHHPNRVVTQIMELHRTVATSEPKEQEGL